MCTVVDLLEIPYEKIPAFNYLIEKVNLLNTGIFI